MTAAARLGISHAEFMGWPHEQRDLMIALGRVERNTGRYGEWLPDVVTAWPDPPNVPIVLDGPYMNWVEKTAQDAEAAHSKAAGDSANTHGMFWGAHPNE